MPSSYLYAINNEGRVFGLSTSGTMWREFMYVGLEFKQLSAVPYFMWTIGGDRQVYVHVHGLDIPIRIKEETYENERWLPLEGFSGRLLPTDRYHFSNQDGSVDRSRDKVKLPSMAWQWEGDWNIETTLDGQPLDHDGWTYAVDFPATFSTKKQWKSCVRRRKWVRYRRYSAMNSWCAIAPLHKDPTKEPFIDVAVGGNQIPGSNHGDLVVWAVTAHGRIMFRVGVSITSPEGQRWSAIKLANGYEVCQVSIGLVGLVWAVLMNGKAIVRTGVTRENPMGDEWAEVEPPRKDLRIIQVSVGMDAVWAVMHDGGVWFRKGVKGEMSGVCEQLATGTGWVEMLSKMALVSVAPNDQVWAIGYDDRCLYYRTGITRSELTGKKWRLLDAPLQLSRASSNASLSSSNRHSICGTPQQQHHQSWGSLNRLQNASESTPLIKDLDEQSRSAPTPTSLKLWKRSNTGTSTSNLEQTSFQESYLNDVKKRSANSLDTSDSIEANVANITISNESLTKSGESIVVSGKGMSSTVKVNPAAWSPVHSVGSMVGVEAHPETDGSIFDPDLTGDSGVYGEDESTAAMYWAECDVLWYKIEAGACFIDPANLPKWLADGNGITQELAEPWRIHILEELKHRLKGIDFDLSKCEKAIEKTSWVKTGDARCKLKGKTTYEDCVVELEWISSDIGFLDSGTLTVLNVDGATTMIQFPLSEIVCVVCCSEPGSPQLAIHTPRLPRSKILRLQFASDTEMEDWMAHLTSVTCQMNSMYGKPGPNSIWATTALGDVFVYDPAIAETNQVLEDIYTQELNVTGKNMPFESILQNGFGPGSSLCISACTHNNADRLSFDLVCCTPMNSQQKNVLDGHNVAFHFSPRLVDNVIVRNTFINSQWGNEERVGGCPLKPGCDFSLKILCEQQGYKIFINDIECTFYSHRISPQSITHLRITGLMTLHSALYKCLSVNQFLEGIYTQELDVAGKNLPFESILQNGFGPRSSLHMSVCVHDDADRLSFNLVCHTMINSKQKNVAEGHDIALHFNPRLSDNMIVRNTYQNGQWGDEERAGGSPLKPGCDFTLKILCEQQGYRIFINGIEYTFYGHRISPQNITHLRIKGLMTLHSVLYKSTSVIIEPIGMFWRQMGGHLKKVETCSSGITWGIGYDNTVWVYTGGCGGTFLKGLGTSNTGINSITDIHNYFVYENQRWNPVTGYTSHGLPTDRYMWSDVTGRHKRTREHTKLLSMHWHWISDWIIDFHTPGGVDRDGWQYATDFPSQYHGRKQFTDYVRRRRWFRRCQLTTTGPWQELGNTKLVDISLYSAGGPGIDCPIYVWAVAANGEALFRRGVSESCPMGVSWEHIPSDQALLGISCGPNGQIWAVGKNGSSYRRFGINSTKPTGDVWQNVEPPSGAHLKRISVGEDVVWALDTMGRLSVCREIQTKNVSEGMHWQTLPVMPNDPIHIDTSVLNAKQGFRHISVGRELGQVWAISGAGIVCRRIGITEDNPAGKGWTTGIGANWQHISVGGLVNRMK